MRRKISIYFSIISVLLTLSHCSKSPEDFTMYKRTFFDDKENKLWKHRVNNSEEAIENLKYFKGLEIDVFYNSYRDNFYISHEDKFEISETETLNQYFTRINDAENYYYWIDFKNLNSLNANNAISRMKWIVDNNCLKDRIIIESPNAKKLKKFNEEGFFTSYWVPASPYYGELNDENKSNIDEITKNLDDCNHNALSSHAENIGFLTEFFPDYKLHVWTNNWDSTYLERINNIRENPNVSIILIDFELPF